MMGRTKQIPSPPHKSSIKKNAHTKPRRKSSLLALVSPDDVTEGTLQVWRTLPKNIRQDPSLAPFQVENERVNGSSSNEAGPSGINQQEHEENVDKMENDEDSVQMHFPNGCAPHHLENVSPTLKESTLTNITNAGTSTHSSISHKNGSKNPWHKHSKKIFLLLLWLCSVAFMTSEFEKDVHHKLLSIDSNDTKSYLLPRVFYGEQILLGMEGPFLDDDNNLDDDKKATNQVTVQLMGGARAIDMIGFEWNLTIAGPDQADYTTPKTFYRTYSIDYNIYKRQKQLEVLLKKNSVNDIAVKLWYDPSPVNIHVGAMCAGFVLLTFYALVIYEVVHRTFAAILSSTMAIGLLSALNDRPLMSDIMRWMNCETLLLLFSMMILVAILTETGIFNYIAVDAFKRTNGRIWPLIFSLCFITAGLSAFLHNVTTILLMTPVTIKLCECLGLNPVPVLIAVILNANIGAAATPLGHVPNLLITGNAVFSKNGVTFISYTVHMTIGAALAFVQTCSIVKWVYQDMTELRTREPQEVTDLRREIIIWERTAASLSTLTRESQIVHDTLVKKVAILQTKLHRILSEKSVPNETYKQTLEELQRNYPIKNPHLLIKSGGVLVFIIAMFFVQSIPEYKKLSPGWCALIGVIFLLIISGKDNMDTLLHRIEWSTLLFFAAMFIQIECLERLRLISWFSQQTINLILLTDDQNVQLAFAIIILMWLSGLLSTVVDSISVTAMMIKIVIAIGESESINLPIQPLVWSIAFGPTLGGNGTLYGASANILCAGIAEQHGYKISFSHFFRRCFPIMIASLVTITGYLIVAHVVFQWHTA